MVVDVKGVEMDLWRIREAAEDAAELSCEYRREARGSWCCGGSRERELRESLLERLRSCGARRIVYEKFRETKHGVWNALLI